MVTNDVRQTIICLNQKGESIRSISKLLKLSRNTVRKIIKRLNSDKTTTVEKDKYAELVPTLKELFSRSKGNVIRVQELLQDEYNQMIAYSTLTRLIRDYHIRKPAERFGIYHFEPGEDMQHDTSPHKILLGDKKITAQCASLILSYSRKLYMQYYPCFTRFEAKSFLKNALLFMAGSCQRCVIDNTSVILAFGSGKDAIISPEMINFGKFFGFEFIAHAVGHANRKGRIERPFNYIENNFLAGRNFKSWDDLNQQALKWCQEIANKKEKRVLGMSPDAAFIIEQPYLQPLQKVDFPIYHHCQRLVDTQGYINLDTNRYSVPEKFLGKRLDIYKYYEKVCVYYQHQEIASHSRLIGKRYCRSTQKNHHSKKYYIKSDNAIKEIEKQLMTNDEVLANYVHQLKKHLRGRGLKQLSRLLYFKRTYPEDAFIAATKQASQYNLYDLSRLENLIIKYVAGDYFNLRDESNYE